MVSFYSLFILPSAPNTPLSGNFELGQGHLSGDKLSGKKFFAGALEHGMLILVQNVLLMACICKKFSGISSSEERKKTAEINVFSCS